MAAPLGASRHLSASLAPALAGQASGRCHLTFAWSESRQVTASGAPLSDGSSPSERGTHCDIPAKGLQALKQAMAAQGDRDREQRVFRYEVQVRAKRPSEGPCAKRAAWLFAGTLAWAPGMEEPVQPLQLSLANRLRPFFLL